MPRHRAAGGGPLDVLDDLPPSHVRCAVGDAWLVAGRPGVYLVLEAEATVDAVREAAEHASRVRVLLADHMTLAPYVHPLLVVDDRATRAGGGHGGGSVVARSRLVELLTSGLPLIDDSTVERIRALVEQGAISDETANPREARGWAGAPSLG